MEVFRFSYYLMFPATVPAEGTQEFHAVLAQFPDLEPGSGRTPTGQAAFQLAGMITTLAISLVIDAFTLNHTFVGIKFSIFFNP